MAKDIIRTRALPEIGRSVVAAKVGQQRIQDFPGVGPDTIRSILQQAQNGGAYGLERYADLCEWVGEDPLVSSCLDTRLDAVSSMPFDVVPGKGDPAMAEQAANMCREMLDGVDNIEQVFENILSALWSGYSLSEIEWVRNLGLWVPKPSAIMLRDVELAEDWTFRVRTYAESASGQWINCKDHPGKFLGFQYRNRASSPLRSGLFRRVVWFWMFRKLVTSFWNMGAERLANPLAIGKVGREASETAREKLKTGLENLSDGQVALLEENTGIEFPDTKFSTSSQVWKDLDDNLKQGIILAILGSLDSVDGGSSGSLARAESQATQTIEPRKMKLAKQLYGVVERDLFEPFLYYNSDKFGGVVPPIPRLQVKKSEERSVKDIFQYHLKGKLVTRDEVRAQLGLDPLPPGTGGEELLDISDQPAPVDAQAAFSAVGGTDAVLPLAQMTGSSAPPYPQMTGSSETSSVSLTSAIADLLFKQSVARANSLQPRPSMEQASSAQSGATQSKSSKARRARLKSSNT